MNVLEFLKKHKNINKTELSKMLELCMNTLTKMETNPSKVQSLALEALSVQLVREKEGKSIFTEEQYQVLKKLGVTYVAKDKTEIVYGYFEEPKLEAGIWLSNDPHIVTLKEGCFKDFLENKHFKKSCYKVSKEYVGE